MLYKDSSLIVLEKPAGIPVYPLKEDEKGTVANELIRKFPNQKNIGPPLEAGLRRAGVASATQAGIVHRLDNDTSGLLVAARDNDTYKKLRAIWNTDQVVKEYTALVLGVAPPLKIIDLPIAHHPSNKKKMMSCETAERAKALKGRPAHTRIRRLKIYADPKGNRYSLVEVTIKTGVRHQIRVHLASIGHPLVGDRLYQNPAKRKQDALHLNRHFLHLSRLKLPHPTTGKILNLKSPLPPDLQEILDRL